MFRVGSRLICAKPARSKIVILPRKNEKDLRDIPDEIRKSIKLVLADTMEQVLEAALRRMPAPLRVEPAKIIEGDKPLGEPEPESRVRRSSFPPTDQPPVVVQGHAPRRPATRQRPATAPAPQPNRS